MKNDKDIFTNGTAYRGIFRQNVPHKTYVRLRRRYTVICPKQPKIVNLLCLKTRNVIEIK